jgi:uncharacterized SAM-binding protein YcdF (DUF218 family)
VLKRCSTEYPEIAMTAKIFPATRVFFPRAKTYAILTVSLLLLALLLHPIWLPWIGEFLVVADPLQKADALVLLSGDEDPRVAYGAQLFQQGYAGWFILTDMHLETIPESQGVYSARVKLKTLEQGVPDERILIIPAQVSTTYEEAIRLKEFTVSKGFRSLIVVTSPYHTRRARWLLRDVFSSSGVALVVRPVSNHSYQAEAWWRDSMDRKQTVMEYAKAGAHLLGCRDYNDCGPLLEKWLRTWQKLGPGE